MIKHLITIVLAGCIGLFVASCDGKTTSNSEKSTNEKSASKGEKTTLSEGMTTVNSEMSASHSDDPIVGTWVEPAVEGSLIDEVGFTLLENGQIISINTGFREFKSWEKIGNQLVIRGLINSNVPEEFADTMDIITVDSHKLVLGQEGYELTYQKK